MKATIEIELDDGVKLSIVAEKGEYGGFGTLHECIKELNTTIRDYGGKLEDSGAPPLKELKELRENIGSLQKVYQKFKISPAPHAIMI